MTPDWQRLFPEAGHRWQMHLRPGDATRFWRGADPACLAERHRWMGLAPERHAQCLPEGRAAAASALAWLSEAAALKPPLATLQESARRLEPDWLLLSADPTDGHRLLGGVVVFPSSWSLEAKLGRPLAEVHAPVPGLQEEVGRGISAFLARLEPGAGWERDNWGLSADTELNHHPVRDLPGLDAMATLETTWLRLETQFLTRLSAAPALLFGIRVSHHRLDALADEPGLAGRLASSLESLPEAVADYKGLAAARAPLIDALRARDGA